MGYKLSLIYSIFTPENSSFQCSMSYVTYWGYSTVLVLQTHRKLAMLAEYQLTIELKQEIRLIQLIPSDIPFYQHFLTLERQCRCFRRCFNIVPVSTSTDSSSRSGESSRKVAWSNNNTNKQSTRFSGYNCYLYSLNLAIL